MIQYRNQFQMAHRKVYPFKCHTNRGLHDQILVFGAEEEEPGFPPIIDPRLAWSKLKAHDLCAPIEHFLRGVLTIRYPLVIISAAARPCHLGVNGGRKAG